jgi:hypothetical protein
MHHACDEERKQAREGFTADEETRGQRDRAECGE